MAQDQKERLASLLAQYAQSPDEEILNELVTAYLPLCHSIAMKFSGRGVETEDLQQVAALALVKAIQRFKPEMGMAFTTYAVPTMAGEVRNYLRDKGSMIRMSRDTRALLYKLSNVREDLTRTLRREPTIQEVATAMELPPEEIMALLDAREKSQVASLEESTSAKEDAQTLQETLGQLEAGYERVEQREWLRWVLSLLTEKEQELLRLRYMERLGQRDCAKRMAVSQMMISRMERRMLTRLREAMGQPPPFA